MRGTYVAHLTFLMAVGCTLVQKSGSIQFELAAGKAAGTHCRFCFSSSSFSFSRTLIQSQAVTHSQVTMAASRSTLHHMGYEFMQFSQVQLSRSVALSLPNTRHSTSRNYVVCKLRTPLYIQTTSRLSVMYRTVLYCKVLYGPVLICLTSLVCIVQSYLSANIAVFFQLKQCMGGDLWVSLPCRRPFGDHGLCTYPWGFEE